MTENINHSVSFKRTKNLGDYNSVSAEITIGFTVDDPADLASVIKMGEGIWDVAMAAVYDRLDLPYEIDPETGRVTEDTSAVAAEQLAAAFAGEVHQSPEVKKEFQGQGVGPTPPFDPKTQNKEERRLNKNWALARLRSHPDEFWDNSAKKASGQYKETAADYTHKETRMGVWV